MVIERKTLRAQVRDELLARMRNGEVQPGESINEVQFATELGVSRTPLREALIALESEGQIRSENGKGFRFVPLSAAEFEDLAPVIAALETLALEVTPLDELKRIGRELETLSAEFSQNVAEHQLIITSDDAWHELMMSACPNRRLIDITTSVRLAFHRYESLLVASDAMIERVAAEHAAIARHLAQGDIPAASAALRTNWLNGTKRILANASSTYLTA